MYAVFEDGSRQYRVSQGDRVRLDHREADIGSRVELGRVLLYSNGDDLQVGQPLVEGARIIGEVTGHPSIKTMIGKYRRRKNYKRYRGHRQPYVELVIKYILLAGEEPPAEQERKAVEESAPPPEQPAESAPPAEQPSGPETGA